MLGYRLLLRLSHARRGGRARGRRIGDDRRRNQVRSHDRLGGKLGRIDGASRDRRGNDLEGLIAKLPDLRAVAFNGGTAARLGMKALAGIAPQVERIALPSSSPAYASMSFERKAAAWAELRRPLGLTKDV